MSQRKESNLTVQIILALFLGVASGFVLNYFSDIHFINSYIVDGLLYMVGKVFISTLKMMVVPLVFVSLLCGVCGLEDIKQLGSLGKKTFLLYLLTTAVAISFALVFALLFKPGMGFNLPTDVSFSAKNAPPLVDVIVNIFPTNPFKSAVEGNMLQIIFFAILTGVGLSLMGKEAKLIVDFFTQLNNVIMRMVTLLMKFAPYGVFALIARVFAEQGFEAIVPMISYFLLVLGVLIAHSLITYPTMLYFLAGLNPITFVKKFRQTMMFAVSTASSNATIPVTMRAVTKRLGVNKSIASFTVPLGATINMDGTAIMQGIATVFISQAYNIPVTPTGYLMVIATATLASIGTAGVPGVGLITLAMVLRQVGLPVEGIGLIIGVDRLLDMVRTAINVCGDATVSLVVAKSENSMNTSVYNDPLAGEE